MILEAAFYDDIDFKSFLLHTSALREFWVFQSFTVFQGPTYQRLQKGSSPIVKSS